MHEQLEHPGNAPWSSRQYQISPTLKPRTEQADCRYAWMRDFSIYVLLLDVDVGGAGACSCRSCGGHDNGYVAIEELLRAALGGCCGCDRRFGALSFLSFPSYPSSLLSHVQGVRAWDGQRGREGGREGGVSHKDPLRA